MSVLRPFQWEIKDDAQKVKCLDNIYQKIFSDLFGLFMCISKRIKWILKKSHREICFCIFLQSNHQVDMKNVGEYQKYLFAYFNALETYGALTTPYVETNNTYTTVSPTIKVKFLTLIAIINLCTYHFIQHQRGEPYLSLLSNVFNISKAQHKFTVKDHL